MITKRQKEILDFVTRYEEKHGFAPSLIEIRDDFRLSSVSTVHQHINALEEKGFLQKSKNQPRGIEVIKNELKQKIISKRMRDNVKKTFSINSIKLQDTIEGVKKIPDESCDIIIVDPPYNIGKDFGNSSD